MTKVLVVYASRHGGTRGIAERIGETLRAEGLDATVAATENARDIGVAEAFVIGSGVYMGSWLKEGTDFIARYESTIAQRPTWLFSSGPLKGSTAGKPGDDPMAGALGPTEGPGSGGRQKLEALAAAVHARENRILYGAFDPTDPPKALSERLVRMTPAFKGVLPPGDFREWDVIDGWAREIAAALRTPVAAG